MRFTPGRILVSRRVGSAMKRSPPFKEFCKSSLKRHVSCDWGDLSGRDARLNDFAIGAHERLFSEYKIPISHRRSASFPDECRIWIVTDEDRSATVVMFPGDE